MELGTQLVWLFVLALPIASIAWTVTHEEVFREFRDYCLRRSRKDKNLWTRKFFYLFTCEYCFSHWVTLAALLLTQFQLLYDGWRGYALAFFALPYISNFYMALYARAKLEVKKEREEIKGLQTETQIKKMVAEEKLGAEAESEPDRTRAA